MSDADRAATGYAYRAEAALWDFGLARAFRDERFHDPRLICQLYAQAGQSALAALSQRIGLTAAGDGSADRPGLVVVLDALRRNDRALSGLLADPACAAAARRLDQTLLRLRTPAGPDFVLRDRFDPTEAQACHRAAELLVEAMLARLLAMDLATLERDHHAERRPPMLDAAFWLRHDPARGGRRS